MKAPYKQTVLFTNMSSTVGDASGEFVSLSSSDEESEYSEKEYLSQEESSDEMYVNLFLNFNQFEPEHDGKEYQTDSESDSDDNCD